MQFFCGIAVSRLHLLYTKIPGMRKIKWLFFSVCLLASFVSDAQFSRGNKMVGASIGSILFTSGSSDYSFPGVSGYTSENNRFGITINPSIGWFVSDDIAIGALININITSEIVNNKTRDTTYSHNKHNQSNFGIGGFVRKYFKTSSKSLTPFGQINISLGSGSTTTKGYLYGFEGTEKYKDSYDGKSSGDFFYNAGLNLGVTKMINSFIGLDVYAGYTYSYTKSSSKTTTTRHYITGSNGDFKSEYEPTIKTTTSNVLLGVGLQIFLERKKQALN